MWDPESTIANSITPRGRYRQNAPLVSARIFITKRVVRRAGRLRLFGRELIRTSGPNVTLGDGVTMLDGYADSQLCDGRRMLAVGEGTVLEVRDVLRPDGIGEVVNGEMRVEFPVGGKRDFS